MKEVSEICSICVSAYNWVGEAGLLPVLPQHSATRWMDGAACRNTAQVLFGNYPFGYSNLHTRQWHTTALYKANLFTAQIFLPDDDFLELVERGYDTQRITRALCSDINLVAPERKHTDFTGSVKIIAQNCLQAPAE